MEYISKKPEQSKDQSFGRSKYFACLAQERLRDVGFSILILFQLESQHSLKTFSKLSDVKCVLGVIDNEEL